MAMKESVKDLILRLEYILQHKYTYILSYLDILDILGRLTWVMW